MTDRHTFFSPPLHLKGSPSTSLTRGLRLSLGLGLLTVVGLGTATSLSAETKPAAAVAKATTASAAAPLPRSTPEAQGVSSAGIRAFVEAADQKIHTLHSFMIVRHGQVIAEGWWKPEGPEKPHVMHSLSKSFTSTAIGIAVAEGKLKVTDPVLKFFPDDAPANPSEQLKAMTVKDLLTMSTGHDVAPTRVDDVPWVKHFLNTPVTHAPGTHFVYNSLATHMLSAIIAQVSGDSLLEYLKPRLFNPLGITNPEWGASPQGNTFGGWGLYVRTEDIAKFGQLYLQKGVWNGQQLVPADWVKEATSKQVNNDKGKPDEKSDWKQGYGYQFWQCRHQAYRGDGKDGQFCIVLPELDTVIAITAETRDMQAELNVVWDYVLPAISKDKSLPANPEEEGKLRETLSQLVVKPAPQKP